MSTVKLKLFTCIFNCLKLKIKYLNKSNFQIRNMSKSNNITNLNSTLEILDYPTKSESDLKEYRLIKLTNGLKALLISDPRPQEVVTNSDTDGSETESDTTDESNESASSEETTDSTSSDDENSQTLAAAALTVDVGSFSDPRDCQGLAHFLEHMIFMGSEKYPQENEFDSYINKCGGSDNADTDCEETNYYFEISEEYLDGALDRFAQLFTTPKLKRDAMTREREVIESEFLSKMQGDSVRRDQLLAEMGNPNHPSSIFTWGNLKTLKHNINDEKLYKKVHEFRKRHYSAHRMYLTVQARLPLDNIQNLVVNNFSNIPNNNLPSDDFSQYNYKNAFKDEFFNQIYYVKPVSNIVQLALTWCLPSFMHEYRCKPHHFLSVLLGYEGRGSLCCYLRKKLWALEVITGIDESGFEHNSMYSLFTITIFLTDEGYDNLNSVLSATFSFIRLLKDCNLYERFKELQTIEATKFRFQTEQDTIDNVEELVLNLKYYPAKDTLTGPNLFYEYDEEGISNIINGLNTFGFNVMITKKDQPGIDFNLTEQWFGTEYTTKDFPKEWKDLWKNTKRMPELFLSEPNKFISTNFDILKPPTSPSNFPEKIFSTDCCELWYRQDHKFNRPKAFMYFYFVSPLANENALNSALLNLYSNIIRHHFVENLYSAEVAGLSHECFSSENGLVLKINGYNEKLYLLVDIITKHMTEFNKNLTLEEFLIFRRQLSKNFYNSIIRPKALNKEIRLSTVENVRWTTFNKYNLLDNITLENLKEFAINFLKELKIISLIQGNVTKEHSIDVIQNILNVIPCYGIKCPTTIQPRTVQIPLGEKYIRVKSPNIKDVNTVITNFYQIGQSTIKLSCQLDLLTMLIEEPLFDILRTKEQLGYDISCSVRDNHGILGYSITVNSQETNNDALDVEMRIEEFRLEFLEILKSMSEIDFEQVKDSLIKLNQIADHKLKDEVIRNWAELTTEEYIFDRREKEVQCLRTITQYEIIEFYQNLVENSNFKRKLSVQVIGTKTPETIDEQINDMPKEFHLEMLTDSVDNDLSSKQIKNIKLFKDQLYIYPVTKTKLEIN